LEGNHDDSIVAPYVHVNGDHPSPRPDQRSVVAPRARERPAAARKLLQREQRAPDALFGLRRQASRRDQLSEAFPREASDLDARQDLEQIGERDGFTPARLLETFLSALPGAGDPFKDLGDASAVRSGVLERGGEDLTGQLDLLDLPLRSEFGELASVLAVKSNVYLLRSGLHTAQGTGCVHGSDEVSASPPPRFYLGLATFAPAFGPPPGDQLLGPPHSLSQSEVGEAASGELDRLEALLYVGIGDFEGVSHAAGLPPASTAQITCRTGDPKENR
jgi:hypothetical protein